MKKMIKDYITNNKKLKEIYEKEKEAQEKRQHNYVPIIFELLKQMSEQGIINELLSEQNK